MTADDAFGAGYRASVPRNGQAACATAPQSVTGVDIPGDVVDDARRYAVGRLMLGQIGRIKAERDALRAKLAVAQECLAAVMSADAAKLNANQKSRIEHLTKRAMEAEGKVAALQDAACLAELQQKLSAKGAGTRGACDPERGKNAGPFVFTPWVPIPFEVAERERADYVDQRFANIERFLVRASGGGS